MQCIYHSNFVIKEVIYMYDEIINIIGIPPSGYEWLVYFSCIILLMFVFSNAIRLIGYVLGARK